MVKKHCRFSSISCSFVVNVHCKILNINSFNLTLSVIHIDHQFQAGLLGLRVISFFSNCEIITEGDTDVKM